MGLGKRGTASYFLKTICKTIWSELRVMNKRVNNSIGT
jgi:hypothetical protein